MTMKRPLEGGQVGHRGPGLKAGGIPNLKTPQGYTENVCISP